METLNREQQYIRAQKKVNEIKKFYKHLVVYILINLVFIGRRIYKDIVYRDESVIEAILDINNYNLFFWWGVVVFIHGFSVLGKDKLFSKNWEERKIKEYMEQ
ncbi:2TM domain-containing protein [uncultured Tenacibaculum sp.]|uniref:2TM domain-containing protein n=1 Tax=uncultured Tenacibaculum sp. TaxID=174713 RepID=UPI0026391F5B|nr:2TM domain-containing protein [uncultured Tenacibaculum sp.]